MSWNSQIAGLEYKSAIDGGMMVKEDGGAERKVSIPELFMLISFKLSEAGQKKIEDQVEKMQVNNAVVTALNDKIGKLSALQAYVKGDESERKKLSDLIGESKYDNWDDLKSDLANANEHIAEAAEPEGYLWQSNLWGANRKGGNDTRHHKYSDTMSLSELRSYTDVGKAHAELKKRLQSAQGLASNKEPEWPYAMKENAKQIIERKPVYDIAVSTRNRIQPKVDAATSAISDAFKDLATFPDGGTRDASGKVTLGDPKVNLLENFDVTKHGNPIHDVEINAADLDALITHLKGKIEAKNSQSQLDMIDLQKFTSENNRYFDMASSMISKGAQNMQTIAGNLRG